MKSDKEILQEALQILQERGFTQGSYAKDSHGQPVQWDDPNACSFCSSGALHKACGDQSYAHSFSSRYSYVLGLLDKNSDLGCIIQTNDKLGLDAVIRAFQQTIAKL